MPDAMDIMKRACTEISSEEKVNVVMGSDLAASNFFDGRKLIIASRINQPGEKILITDLKGLPSIHEDLTPYTLIVPAKLDSNEAVFESD